MNLPAGGQEKRPLSALDARGVATGPTEQEGDAGRKTLVRDPDGNSIAIIEVARGGN